MRTAGCVYSLAAFANEYRGTALGERAEKSCRRAILYLLRHLESLPEERGTYVSYRSSSEGALGANALLLRALQFAPFREEFAQEHEQLRNAVLAMYRLNGTFRSRVAEDSDGPDDQDYYPGEALLALAVEEERNPEARSVRETFGPALQYFRTSFAENPKTSYVLWHTECWARVSAIALRQSDPDFAANCIAFVKELADYVCAMQLLDTAQTRTLGGFARSGKPTAASLAYAEGILHAAQPMKNAGDQETWIRYMYAGGLAFRFCLRLQIQPCQATFFSTPSNIAVGSVTTDLDRFSVRADNAQHLVTLGLQYLKVFEIYQ